MSDRVDTRDNHEDTREYGSMFDLRAAGFPKGLAHTPAGRQRTPHSVNVEVNTTSKCIGLTTFSRTDVRIGRRK